MNGGLPLSSLAAKIATEFQFSQGGRRRPWNVECNRLFTPKLNDSSTVYNFPDFW